MFAAADVVGHAGGFGQGGVRGERHRGIEGREVWLGRATNGFKMEKHWKFGRHSGVDGGHCLFRDDVVHLGRDARSCYYSVAGSLLVALMHSFFTWSNFDLHLGLDSSSVNAVAGYGWLYHS